LFGWRAVLCPGPASRKRAARSSGQPCRRHRRRRREAMLTVASTAQRLISLGSPPLSTPPPLGGLNDPRGARRWHARLRVAPLYSVDPVLGPDHEANHSLRRQGSEAAGPF
jgi:hypothetical protein